MFVYMLHVQRTRVCCHALWSCLDELGLLMHMCGRLVNVYMLNRLY